MRRWIAPFWLCLLVSWAAGSRAAEPAANAQEAPAKLSNTLRWSTASEVDNFGFDVYRAEAEAGPFTRLTAKPIPGAGTSDTPHKYAFEDDTIAEGRDYWYYVESIAMDGTREHFTPVAKVKAKHRQPSSQSEKP